MEGSKDSCTLNTSVAARIDLGRLAVSMQVAAVGWHYFVQGSQ